MNIVIFGAAGWTGRAILNNLEENGHHVRAAVRGPSSWEKFKDIDGEWRGEETYGDMADFHYVERAVQGMDAAVHSSVYFPKADDPNDNLPFLANLKGLWNVLECARRRGLKRVVHIGSCQTVHPKGVFFTADVRRPDGTLYAACKRLQEEMCRQFHEAHGLSIVVLRPDYIVDSRLGIDFARAKLGPSGRPTRNGMVCRHDLAEACRLALEHPTIEFDIFHIVGTPEADETCNVARSREVLGLTYKGDLEQYR
ncbi:MAG: NAD(P)-dependent oxidoreductase [Planctomycetota bacterium]